MEDLYDFLIPIGVCVVLPVMIVWLVSRSRRHETDRKAEIMLKAIEAGVPIDPALFAKPAERKAKTRQEKLLENLSSACICSLMGLFFLAIGIVDQFTDWEGFLSPDITITGGGVLLAVGISLFVTYFSGKKMLSEYPEDQE